MHGLKQPGTVVSGSRALVTGAARGRFIGSNDVDGGTTTIRSRAITLPADPADFGNLTFSYAFAHSAASSEADAFRALVQAEDGTRTVVFERKGAPTDVDGTWKSASVSLSAYAGQTIRIVFLAKDGGRGNLVEAAVDNVRIRRP
jgi:aminopeptidase S